MFEDGSESYKLDGTTPTFASTAHLMFVSENRVRRRGAQVIFGGPHSAVERWRLDGVCQRHRILVEFLQTAAWLTKQQL